MPIYRNYIPYLSFYMIQPTHLMSKFCSNIKQISYYLYLLFLKEQCNNDDNNDDDDDHDDGDDVSRNGDFINSPLVHSSCCG